MLRTILSEEMTHKPNNCDNEWNRACCPEGWYQAMEPKGKDIFITSTGAIREKDMKNIAFEMGFQHREEQGAMYPGKGGNWDEKE